MFHSTFITNGLRESHVEISIRGRRKTDSYSSEVKLMTDGLSSILRFRTKSVSLVMQSVAREDYALGVREHRFLHRFLALRSSLSRYDKHLVTSNVCQHTRSAYEKRNVFVDRFRANRILFRKTNARHSWLLNRREHRRQNFKKLKKKYINKFAAGILFFFCLFYLILAFASKEKKSLAAIGSTLNF